jgi:hypothetical protein
VPVCGKCIASQGLRAEAGVLPTEVGPIWLTEADAQIPRQVVLPTCSGIRSAWSGAVLLHTCTYKPWYAAGDCQDDCYKLLSSCILASVLDKGEPAAR